MKKSRSRSARSWAAGLLCAFSWASVAWAEDAPISEKARAHFNAGVNFLQDPDGARHEEAYREFKAAYAASPSWKILGNLSITAMKLERDGEAIEAFQKYLAEGGATLEPDELAQVQKDLATLTAGVVTVELSSEPPGAFVIDERIAVQALPVKNGYGPVGSKMVIGIRAGQHRFTAHLDGHADQTWVIDARSGDSHQHTFKLAPASAPAPAAHAASQQPKARSERPIPNAVYVGLAATGLLAIGAGVTGGISMANQADFRAANDGRDTARAQDLRDRGTALNLTTDVLLGGALVAGGISAVLYFRRPSATVESARLRVSPLVSPRLNGLHLATDF